MALGDIVRSGIATAKSIVGGPGNLMDVVTIQYWEGDDATGTGTYSAAVTFEAVVIRGQRDVRKPDGQEAVSTAYVAFLEELPNHGVGTGRREPLDERDLITLSDGTTGPILSISGLMDRKNSKGFYSEVYLG